MSLILYQDSLFLKQPNDFWCVDVVLKVAHAWAVILYINLLLFTLKEPNLVLEEQEDQALNFEISWIDLLTKTSEAGNVHLSTDLGRQISDHHIHLFRAGLFVHPLKGRFFLCPHGNFLFLLNLCPHGNFIFLINQCPRVNYLFLLLHLGPHGNFVLVMTNFGLKGWINIIHWYLNGFLCMRCLRKMCTAFLALLLLTLWPFGPVLT
jgi:hypothetical protein